MIYLFRINFAEEIILIISNKIWSKETRAGWFLTKTGKNSEEKGNRVKRYYKEGRVRNRPNWEKLGTQKLM